MFLYVHIFYEVCWLFTNIIVKLIYYKYIVYKLKFICNKNYT